MKNQCALSKNRLFWLKKGNFFTFFLKTEGLVSSKLLKKQSTVVSWPFDLLSRCDFLCVFRTFLGAAKVCLGSLTPPCCIQVTHEQIITQQR